jgi:hypothetical protein
VIARYGRSFVAEINAQFASAIIATLPGRPEARTRQGPRDRPADSQWSAPSFPDRTQGNWVSAYRRDHAGEEPPLTITERARLRETEREIRELRMENEFLKKAAAYFASDHR